jgi:cell shape-determining protein MreC
MARKQPKLPRPYLFAGLLITSIVLLLLPQNITKSLNFLFSRIFNPVLSIGRARPAEVLGLSPSAKNFVSRTEYDKLKVAYDNLWADLRAEHKRYEKLARIRSGLPKPGPKLVLAKIENVSLSGLRRELIINKGRADGLKADQYVLGENSIVGTVSEISEATARVRVVTDVNHKIKVGIWCRDRKEYIISIMHGDGKNSGKIPLISREYEIRTGDTVYATAVAGFLEAPRVIGQVQEVKPDEKEPLLWDITVKPIQDASLLTHVAVIVSAS